MISVGKVVTLAPTDLWIKGSVPLTIGVAAVGPSDLQVSVTVTQGTIVWQDQPKKAVDYGARIPNDLYVSRFDLNPGTYNISASVASDKSSHSESLTVRVFDKPDYTATVTNQTQLNTALNAIKNGSYKHARLTISSGSYTWTSGCDLSTKNTLVTFQGSGDPQFLLTAPLKLLWGYWSKIRFGNSSNAAVQVASGSTMVFERCSFANSNTGLLCQLDSNVRVENCNVVNVTTGVVNAKVIRSLSWKNIEGVVFQNCPIIGGTFGYRSYDAPDALSDVARIYKSATWAAYDGPQYGIVIRNNLLYGDYSNAIKIDVSADSVILIGNVFNVAGNEPVRLNSLTNAIICNNTINNTGSAKTSLVVSGNTTGNYVACNYFGRISSQARKLFESADFWGYNAYSNYVSMDSSDLVDADPEWQNNYLWLSATSPLRFTGIQHESITYCQGVLSEGQIGALPHHPDITLTHIYQNLRKDPIYGTSLPDVVVS